MISPMSQCFARFLVAFFTCWVSLVPAQTEHLKDRILFSLLRAALGNTDSVYQDFFQYRGNSYVLTSSDDAPAKIWRMRDMLSLIKDQPLPIILAAHTQKILHSTSFEYRGDTYLLTSSADSTAKLWRMHDLFNLPEGQASTPVTSLSSHTAEVLHSFLFKYNGDTYILTSSADSTAKLWRMQDLLSLTKGQTPTPVISLDAHSAGAVITHSTSFEYRKDTYLLTSFDDNTVKLWRMGDLLNLTENQAPTSVISLDMHSQGTSLKDSGDTYPLSNSGYSSPKLLCSSGILMLSVPEDDIPTPVACDHSNAHKTKKPRSTSFWYYGRFYLLTISNNGFAKLWRLRNLLSLTEGQTPTPVTFYSQTLPGQL